MRNRNVNRHIYLAPTSKHYEWAMYKLGLRVVQRGKFVLLITKHPFYLPLLISEEPTELWQLERFIVVLLQDFDSVHQKLFQLKEWVHLPDLIIVDLYSYIKEIELEADAELNDSVTTSTLVRHIARCAACLLDYADTVQRRKIQQKNIITLSEEKSFLDNGDDDEVSIEALSDNDTLAYSTETLPNVENEQTTTSSILTPPPMPNKPIIANAEDSHLIYADSDNVESNKSSSKIALLNNMLIKEDLQEPKLSPTTFSSSNNITKAIASTQPMFSCCAIEHNSGQATQLSHKTIPSLTKLTVLTPAELNVARTHFLQFLQQSLCQTTPQHSAKQEKPVDAVFIMPSNPAPMTQRQLEVIVVLYFYEQCVCYDFEEIVRRVQSTQKLSV